MTGGQTMLKRLARSGPDVAKLLQRKDLPRLVQALQHESFGVRSPAPGTRFPVPGSGSIPSP